MTDPNHESSNNSTCSVVPYFVLRLDDNNNKAKALFTVPEDLAASLIHYPILCRGAAFALVLDNNDNTYLQPSNDNNNNKMMEKNCDGSNHVASCFLSTTYESVYPEETAQEIARRLSIRIDNTREEFQQQQNDGGNNDTSTFLFGNDILGL